MSLTTSIVTGSIALGLVGLTSLTAIKSITDRICRATQYDEASLAKTVYRDEDGEATEESLRAFSDQWPRIAIVLLSISGFSVSLALAVLSTLRDDLNSPLVNWLQFGTWVSNTNSERACAKTKARNRPQMDVRKFEKLVLN